MSTFSRLFSSQHFLKTGFLGLVLQSLVGPLFVITSSGQDLGMHYFQIDELMEHNRRYSIRPKSVGKFCMINMSPQIIRKKWVSYIIKTQQPNGRMTRMDWSTTCYDAH